MKGDTCFFLVTFLKLKPIFRWLAFSLKELKEAEMFILFSSFSSQALGTGAFYENITGTVKNYL